MNAYKSLLVAMTLVFSGAAFAGNGDVDSAGNIQSGGFLCVTDAGKRLHDGAFITGDIDGEARVTNLRSSGLTQQRDAKLEIEGLSIGGNYGFNFNAVEPLEDDSTIITIKASNSSGKSRATFTIRNGDFVTHREGICFVLFKAGI
ncbi:MAG: hypothetical protein J7501_03085 [Bdellovibrio sp.]|nr:hypothetical protein [Bdellovibrio sp.]